VQCRLLLLLKQQRWHGLLSVCCIVSAGLHTCNSFVSVFSNSVSLVTPVCVPDCIEGGEGWTAGNSAALISNCLLYISKQSCMSLAWVNSSHVCLFACWGLIVCRVRMAAELGFVSGVRRTRVPCTETGVCTPVTPVTRVVTASAAVDARRAHHQACAVGISASL
jgi:hypothetical protein